MEKLGIEPLTLLAQVVNFLIILWLLNKFLYGPVMKVLNQRKAKIEESLEQVKQIEERLAKVEEATKLKMKEASKQADSVIQEAKKTGQGIQEQAKQQASKETERMMQKSQERLAAQEQQISEQLKGKLSDLVVETLEKVLADMPEETKKVITKQAIKKIGR